MLKAAAVKHDCLYYKPTYYHYFAMMSERSLVTSKTLNYRKTEGERERKGKKINPHLSDMYHKAIWCEGQLVLEMYHHTPLNVVLIYVLLHLNNIASVKIIFFVDSMIDDGNV